ncbi:aminotransferase class I/II-fold pyridoxal phosphate-dependent enzyme [Candidatus Kuenenbacteria bacterium]|nr:aminotransferase class I/II-fold pyridoxal phosphate-dependent enzyme [Candidatus Kuenenbacteria bacterium]
MKKAIVVLIKGRAGSVGFPGKNTYPILDRPLMRYPMMAAENSKHVTHLYFSTEAEEYKQIARQHNWNVIDRPQELASATALSTDVFIHAYESIKEDLQRQGYEIEFLVLLMCNAPMILAHQIDQGIEMLRNDPEAHSAVTVSKYNMWSPLRARKENEHGYLDPFVPFETFGDPNTMNCDRDSQGDVWFADMGVSIVRPHCISNMDEGLLPQKWMGQKILGIKQERGFDIDYEHDLPLVENWLKEKGFSSARTPYDFSNLELPVKPHLKNLVRTKNPTEPRLNFLRLDKNENITGLDELFVNKFKNEITAEFISAYPELDPLYKKLANHLKVTNDNLYITAGSDAAIKATFEVFVQPRDKVLILDPTYAMFYVYTNMFEAELIRVGYNPDLTLSVQKILEQITLHKPKLICIANPNSPTGTILSLDEVNEIIKLAAEQGSIVLLDEAYYPYHEKTGIDLINHYPNLLITRTFSKALGLASARIGFAVAHPRMIECLHKVRPMYETNAFAVRFAEMVLDNENLVTDHLVDLEQGKQYLMEKLGELGVKYHQTYANFINIDVGSQEKSIAIEKFMHDNGILIKGGFSGVLENCIRINFGNVNQMQQFLGVFQQTLSKENKKEHPYDVPALDNYYSHNRNSWDTMYETERQLFEKLNIENNGQLGKILDVGCACGGLAMALSEKFQIQEYLGIDIGAPMIALAPSLCAGLHFDHSFICDNILDTCNLTKESFDLVTSLSCADWHTQTKEIIDTCWGYVKPGGYLVISLRLTTEPGSHTLDKSYQYVWFDETKPIPKDTPITNYVVFNVKELFELFENHLPNAKEILDNGTFHAPSFSSRTPYNELYFSVFAIRKSLTENEITIYESKNWQEEFLNKLKK